VRRSAAQVAKAIYIERINFPAVGAHFHPSINITAKSNRVDSTKNNLLSFYFLDRSKALFYVIDLIKLDIC
jgi:hypothetical protein